MINGGKMKMSGMWALGVEIISVTMVTCTIFSKKKSVEYQVEISNF